MSPEEYACVQRQITVLASVISTIEIEEFIVTLHQAQTIAPIVDPTLFIKAADDLEDVLELANAVLKVKQVTLRRIAKEKARGKKVSDSSRASDSR